MIGTDAIRTRLRPEVEILRLGPRQFLLVDPISGAQFRCGVGERYLLHLLDKATSPEEVRIAYAQRFGQDLPQRQLLEFLEQLHQLRLITDPGDATPAPAVLADPPPSEPPAPFSAADPSARLNRFFDVLVLLFGWILHPLWLVPLFLLALMALTTLVYHWTQCWATLAIPTQWLPAPALLLLLPLQTILVLNLPHALFRGLICRRFGGRVRAFGLRLYRGMVPNFHCDIGDSFLLFSPRGRWTMLTASIWCILAIASASTVFWGMCRPNSFWAVFWVWMLPAGWLGLLFHCIPFFKMSGYSVLCTLCKEPLLRERALAETKAWLGGSRAPEALTDERRYWLRLYGVSYYLFRLLFDSTIILVVGYYAVRKFQGVGALAFGIPVLFWYRASWGSFIMSNTGSAWLMRKGGSWWLRWPLRLALAVVVVGIGFLPYNYEIVGQCRIIPLAQVGIRSSLNDEITQVHVAEGQYVTAGTVLATLSGRNAREGYLLAQADLDKARAQLDLAQAGFRPESVQIAVERVELAQVRVRYFEQEMRREENLMRTNAASREQYDRVKRDLDAAQEQLLSAKEYLAKLKSGAREETIRAAEAAVQHQEDRLNYYHELLTLTKVATPINGKVVTPYMEQKLGQQVKPGDLIAVIQDLSRLRVEVAADDTAAAAITPGMIVKVRLHGFNGELLTGTVQQVAQVAEQDRTIGVGPVRTDREAYDEQLLNIQGKVGGGYHVRVYVDLDPAALSGYDLRPEMTGYARIIVDEHDVFWHALVRPVARFLRTEVWSWLP